MKRNIFIVLILVLLGGGFMYLNSNTDYFTGFLTFVPQQNETSTQFTSDIDTQILNVDPDAHIVDKLIYVRGNILASLTKQLKDPNLSDADRKELEGQMKKTNDLFRNTITQLIDIHNLTNFGEIQIKKVDGQYVPCERSEIGNLPDCKSFKSFGYSDDNIRDILGLDKYVQNSIQIKDSTKEGFSDISPEMMEALKSLRNDSPSSIEPFDSIQDQGVVDTEIFQSQF